MEADANADRACLEASGGAGDADICVHIHLARTTPPEAARRALASACRQSLAPARVLVTCEEDVAPPCVRHALIEIVPGTFASRLHGLHAALARAHALGAHLLVPLEDTARLPRQALRGYAAYRIACVPGTHGALLYADEDTPGQFGLGTRPWLKPQWDPRLLLAQDYLTGACALPVAALLHAFESTPPREGETLFERLLAWTRTKAPSVRHIPRIGVRRSPDAWRDGAEARRVAVARVLGETGEARTGEHGGVRVDWALPVPAPQVSIVIATRDKVDLLRTCLEGVLHATDYPHLDIVVADNDSREPETLDYLDSVARDPRVQVVRWPHPFNYSAINNHAARFARGEFLCLLNNDIEVIAPDWLAHMVREGVQDGVGAVGARLLYPDGTIQHAGVAIGIGNAAGHVHRGLPSGEPGYFAQAHVTRGASAVTAACLLVRKAHFDAVGGLDETHLAVAYNDVDLCLKLRAQGLANIYAPAATLIHHESKSRGLDFAPEHMARYLRELGVFQERWGTVGHIDPWHHPRLDAASEIYADSHGSSPR